MAPVHCLSVGLGLVLGLGLGHLLYSTVSELALEVTQAGGKHGYLHVGLLQLLHQPSLCPLRDLTPTLTLSPNSNLGSPHPNS